MVAPLAPVAAPSDGDGTATDARASTGASMRMARLRRGDRPHRAEGSRRRFVLAANAPGIMTTDPPLPGFAGLKTTVRQSIRDVAQATPPEAPPGYVLAHRVENRHARATRASCTGSTDSPMWTQDHIAATDLYSSPAEMRGTIPVGGPVPTVRPDRHTQATV